MKADSKSKKNDASNAKEMTQDEFVYLIWSNLVFVKIFFTRFLPPLLLALIDLESLELGSTRFTNREGRDSFADIVYKFRFKSGKRGVFALLIEHKSQYDRFVSFQIMRYELCVLELMEQEPEKYVDDDGLFPVPYSILLCQTPCPQFDAIVSRCEELDYGIRSRFQQICFNEIDVDSLLDEPLLYLALGLTRYAGYKDKDKESRQSELLALFRSLTNLDPTKRENLKETWKFIFEVSLNYLSRIMRNTSFNMKQFKYELLNAKGYEMQSQIYADVFEDFFYDDLKPYKEQIAIAQAETAEANAKCREAETRRREAEAKTQEAEAKTQKAEAKTQEAEAKTQEALSRAQAVDELFFSTMYETICNALRDSGKVKRIPRAVSNRIQQIKSYPFLCKLLRNATSIQNDYATFLAVLEEDEK